MYVRIEECDHDELMRAVPDRMILPCPDELADLSLLRDALDKCLSTLEPRDEEVIRMVFGLGREKKTQAEVAMEFRTSASRIWQLFHRAMRRMEHPIRRLKLEGFVDEKVNAGYDRQWDPTRVLDAIERHEERREGRWNPTRVLDAIERHEERRKGY